MGVYFMSKSTKNIIQVVLTAMGLLLAYTLLPELSGWLGILLSLIIVPIPLTEELFEKYRISLKARLIACVVLFLIILAIFLFAGGYL